MDRQEAREQLKGQLRAYVESITKKSKGDNMYVCPLCGSGTGSHSTGAFSIKDGTSWKCFSCNEGGDIFDLIGKYEGITDHSEQLKRAGELFGISINPYRATAQEDFREYQKQDKIKHNTQQSLHNNTYTTIREEAEPDYSDFFLQANKDIEKTSYHRGLTLETLNRFKIGYVESWRHPKAPKMEASPRLIIPTSPYSYLARYAGAGDYINYLGNVENKRKVGKVRVFNSGAIDTATSPIFIVEGELDALSIIDVGGEAIALGSTAYTKLLLTMLDSQKPSQPLIIAMDNDKAGARANKELTEGLERLKIPFDTINIAHPYKDANEALNRDKEAFRAAVKQAENTVEQAVEQAENIEAEVLKAEKEQLKREAAVYSLQDFIRNIEESKRAAFLPTGFNNLDSILDGGLYAGLYVVGAISSLGKTTFCLQVADQVAQRGQDVLIFSLEMAKNELIAKSVSRLTLIKDLEENGSTAHAKTTRDILTGTRYKDYSQTERELINGAIAAYGQYGANIYITEGIGNVGIEEIRDKVQKHTKLTGKAPVVVIDYLQIIAPAEIRATDKQNTDKAVLELKRLSRDYSIPVIGISSFNRDNYTAPVNLASFKESGAIEYSSDVLIGLQYEGMDYQEGETEKKREKRIRELMKEAVDAGKAGKPQKIQVKILKNRNGSKGDTLLDFYPMFNYFTDKREGAGHSGNSGSWSKAKSNYNR